MRVRTRHVQFNSLEILHDNYELKLISYISTRIISSIGATNPKIVPSSVDNQQL